MALLCAMATHATAATEEFSRAELFGGYQFTRIGGAGGVNANGWDGALTGNVNRWFGVSADFSGAYKSVGDIGAKAHTFTVGPQLSWRGGRVTAFAHVLMGGFHASAGLEGLSAGTSGFTTMVGGGVDAKAGAHVSVRVFQLDWFLWRTMGITEKQNARISAGLVFRF